jgi:2-polyprenyl-3-methyl-5-hydroxy-6-metoxy-1,4-benzoquinol methylase
MMEELTKLQKEYRDIIKEYMPNIETKVALEIGCDNGQKSEELMKLFKFYMGVDKIKSRIKEAIERFKDNKNITFIVDNVEKIAQYNLHPDVIIMMNIYTLLNSKRVMPLLLKILNRGGIIVIEEKKLQLAEKEANIFVWMTKNVAVQKMRQVLRRVPDCKMKHFEKEDKDIYVLKKN